MALIAPSILASNWGKLDEEVSAVCAAGADYLHLDVMDGSFVPPITFGADFVRAVKKVSSVPLDVHLMIVNPEKHVEAFVDAGAANVTIHAEVCPHLHRNVQRIHELGAKAGVAINPGTAVSTVKDILPFIDLLLIMTVNPGWGGQSFIEHSEKKIAEAKRLIDSLGAKVKIEVDGGINDATSKQCVKAGAEILVAGSYIFSSKGRYKEAIASLR